MIVKPDISEGHEFYDHGYQTGDDEFGQSEHTLKTAPDGATTIHRSSQTKNTSAHTRSSFETSSLHSFASSTARSLELEEQDVDENQPAEDVNESANPSIDFGRLSFFGRQHEFHKVHQLYERLVMGGYQIETDEGGVTPSASFVPVCFVRGNPGTGKTRFLQHYAEQLQRLTYNPHEHYAISSKHCVVLCASYASLGRYSGSNGVVTSGNISNQTAKLDAIVRAVSNFSCDMLDAVASARSTSQRQQLHPFDTARLQSATKQLESIRQRCQRHLTESERELLQLKIPSVSVLFGTENDTDGNGDEMESHRSGSSNRRVTNSVSSTILWSWTSTLIRFFQVLSMDPDYPVVLILDDIQDANFALLSTLLASKNISNLYVVAAMRTRKHEKTDVPLESALHAASSATTTMTAIRGDQSTVIQNEQLHQQSRLSNFLQKLQQQRTDGAPVSTSSPPSSSARSIQFVDLHALSKYETMHFLIHALEYGTAPSSPNKVPQDFHKIASVIYKKTNGYFDFLFQTLQDLQQRHILVYSFISFTWEWNDAILRDNQFLDQALSNTIIESIQSRIKSRSYKQALVVASYILMQTQTLVFDIEVLSRMLLELQPLLEGIFRNQHSACDSEMLSDIIIHEQPDSASSLTTILEEAVLESYLQNTIGGATYQFTSDKVQQAAYNLIPYGEQRNAFRYELGMKLYAMAQTSDRPNTNGNKHGATASQWMNVCAADHLNSVPNKDHLLIVQLNLKVGEQYLDTLAEVNDASTGTSTDYVRASAYLQKAQIAMRKIRDPWSTEHYDLSIRLLRARCNVELALGHFELGHSLGCEVLEHATCMEDKLPTYFAMANAMGRQNRQDDAFQFLRTVLWSMQEYPQRFYAGHAAKGMMKVRQYFHHSYANDDEFLASMPRNTNVRKVYAMRFMIQAGIRAFFAMNSVEWIVLLSRTLRITKEYGLCESSAMAFCNYAVWFATIGNSQENALRYARLARRTLSLTNSKALEGWVLYLLSSFIYGWSQPHTEVISTFQHGYRSAMETGEFEVGFFNWHMCNFHAYTAGYPLAPILATFANMIEQAQLYSLAVMIHAVKDQLRFLRIMTGEDHVNWKEVETMPSSPSSSTPPSLTAVTTNEALSSSPDRFRLLNTYLTKLQLAVYFGRFSLALVVSKGLWDISDNTVAYNLCVLRNLFTGLAAAGMYRQTNRRRYLKQLKRIMLETKELSSTRGANSLHRTLLLEAEWKGLKRSTYNQGAAATVAAGVGSLQQLINGRAAGASNGHSRRVYGNGGIRNRRKFLIQVKAGYDAAIECALKSGHVQDAALGCELAGEYFLRHRESEFIGEYFTKAAEFYQEWGAGAKVKDLERQRVVWLDRARVEHAKKATKEGLVISRAGVYKNPIAQNRGERQTGDTIIFGGALSRADSAEDANDRKDRGVMACSGDDGKKNKKDDVPANRIDGDNEQQKRALVARDQRNGRNRRRLRGDEDSSTRGDRLASFDMMSRKSGSNPFSVGVTAASMVAREDDDNVSLLSYESDAIM